MKIKSAITAAAIALTSIAVNAGHHETGHKATNHKQSDAAKDQSSIMDTKDPRAIEVRQLIDDLIQTATSYDVDALERIYHDDLQVVMIDTNDNVNTANKSAFKGLFKSKKEAGDPPMNTWAKYHRIEVEGDTANVLLSRKNDLSGTNMILLLSIDLVHQDNRWQVKRETIFMRPDDQS